MYSCICIIFAVKFLKSALCVWPWECTRTQQMILPCNVSVINVYTSYMYVKYVCFPVHYSVELFTVMDYMFLVVWLVLFGITLLAVKRWTMWFFHVSIWKFFLFIPRTLSKKWGVGYWNLFRDICAMPNWSFPRRYFLLKRTSLVGALLSFVKLSPKSRWGKLYSYSVYGYIIIHHCMATIHVHQYITKWQLPKWDAVAHCCWQVVRYIINSFVRFKWIKIKKMNFAYIQIS